MKEFIRKLLKEAMLNQLFNWETNLSDFGDVLTTLISKDNETGDKLYLFVGFTNLDGEVNYTYSFLLVDNNDIAKTSYMTNRGEVGKYLPYDIKNKNKIFPIIEAMTRKLLDKQLPEKIVRKTSEPISGDSLIRYEQITNIMVNEYGYKLIEKSKDNFGSTKWVLTKGEANDINKDMEESYTIEHEYTAHEIAQKAFGHIDLKQLKG